MFFGISFIASPIQAQSNREIITENDKISFGPGLGLMYGGLGFCLSGSPVKNLGIMAGAGYNFIGFGYNFSLKYRFETKNSKRKVLPYIIGMYGYNAVVARGSNIFNLEGSTYYGPSAGVGIDLARKNKSNTYFTLALIVPVRSEEAQRHADAIGASFTPVTLSLGIMSFIK